MAPYKPKSNPNRNNVRIYNRLQRYGITKNRSIDENAISTILSAEYIDEHNNVLTAVINSNDNEYDEDTLLYEVVIDDTPKLMTYFSENRLSLSTTLQSTSIYGVIDGGNYVILGIDDTSDVHVQSLALFNYMDVTANLPSELQELETTESINLVFCDSGLFMIHDKVSKRYLELTDILSWNKNHGNITTIEWINSAINASFTTIT